jgi:hypothetical protein
VSATALSIIGRLQEAGATLECKDDGRVRFSAPVPLPGALIAEAREHREAIAAALAINTVPKNRTIPDNPTALVGRVAAEALDGCKAPEPAADWQEQDRERLQSVSRAITGGYLRAALQRPPSWADPAALPSRGFFCSCCQRQRWWREREAPKGWRCSICHPPDHLPADAVMELTT